MCISCAPDSWKGIRVHDVRQLGVHNEEGKGRGEGVRTSYAVN